MTKKQHLEALLGELQKPKPSLSTWKPHVLALDLPLAGTAEAQMAAIVEVIDLKFIQQMQDKPQLQSRPQGRLNREEKP